LLKIQRGHAFKTLILADNRVQPATIGSCRQRLQAYVQNTYHVASFNFLPDIRLGGLQRADLERALKEQRERQKFGFAILILQKKHVGAYAAFKDLCDRQYGIQCICITETSFPGDGRNPGSYMGNITLKANLKTAGSNHSVASGYLQKVFPNTLVLGADVTHPGPGALIGSPSIAAIVGSVDDHAGRFLGSMRLQSKSDKEVCLHYLITCS
jgi:eukaryotic translation initiation factor 2C